MYTQHTPYLVNTLEALVKGRLKDCDYPCIEKGANAAGKLPKLVIVYVVGGTTFEEAKAVAELNSQVI